MESIDRALKLKAELDSFRPLNKEDELRIMQKFRLDWNYHSNNLEGNSLTYGETKALILFGITAQGKPLKDHFEITGHDEAIKWVLEIVKQERPITENFIRELHTLILKEPYEVDAITPDGQPTKKKIKIGAYKSTPNHVKTKTGEIFRFASPEETPALMGDLISWYQTALQNTNNNPIFIAANFHYRYIRIHPFDDGNGRTARMLMNFILLQLGYPPVIIKTDDKMNYFSALRQADAGIIEPFIDYIADNLIRSLEIMIKGAKGESIEDVDDFNKELALLERRLRSAGQKVEVSKNQEVLLTLYDQSFSDLIQKFIARGELFERFYISSTFKFQSGAMIYVKGKSNTISRIRGFIKDDVKDIYFIYDYEGFNQIGFESFKHKSQVRINFGHTSYSISNSSNSISLQKDYGDQLNEDEVDQILNIEFKRHKDILEQKIQEVERKK